MIAQVIPSLTHPWDQVTVEYLPEVLILAVMASIGN